MSIRFPCTECSQLLSIREEKIGREVRCPKCRHTLTVPTAEAAALALAERTSQKQAARQADPALEDFVVYDRESSDQDVPWELSPTSVRQADEIDRDRVSIPRSLIYIHGGLLAGVALVSFLLGLLLGGIAGSSSGDAVASKDRTPVTIRGQLHWENANGVQSPDDFAVIVALPRGVDLGGHKLATDALSPDRPQPDADHAALQRISSLGGAYQRADERGQFALSLPPGQYHVLLVSHNLRRSGSNIDARDLASLGDYFAEASTLIGPFVYRWSIVDLPRQPLDWSFVAAQ